MFFKPKKTKETELSKHLSSEQKESLIDIEQKNQEREQQKKPKKIVGTVFNPNVIPGEWDLALDHMTSRKVGFESDKELYCKCCGFRVDRQQMGIMTDNMELSYLGAGIPLYFEFIKFCIFLLTALLIVSGIYNVISNLSGNYCDNWKSVASKAFVNLTEFEKNYIRDCSSIFLKFSYANKLNYDQQQISGTTVPSTTFKAQAILNLIAIFPIIGIFQWFRYKIRFIAKAVDEKNEDGTDYTICVKNIPTLNQLKKFKKEEDISKINYQKDLEEYFKSIDIKDENKNSCKPNVEKVVLTFNMDQYNELNKALQLKIKQKKTQLSFAQQSEQNFEYQWNSIEQLDKEIDEKQKEIDQLCDSLKSNVEKQREFFAGIAFVTLKYEWEKKTIEDEFKIGNIKRFKTFYQTLKNQENDNPDQRYLSFHGQILIIEEAVDPSDVYWDNQHYTTWQKLKMRAITFAINAGILILSFAIISGLTQIQDHFVSEGQGLDANGQPKKGGLSGKIGMIISFIIIGFNITIQMIMLLLGQREHYSTRTSFLTACCKKMAIAQFVNTCIMQFIATKLYDVPTNALILNVSVLFIMQLFINPIKFLSYPAYLMRYFFVQWNKRKNQKLTGSQLQRFQDLCKQRQNAQNDPSSKLSHQDQIELMAYPEFPHYTSTSQIMCLVLFSVFYAYLIPLGLISTIIQLIILYWVFKYNLLYKSSVMNDLSSVLSSELIEFMEYIPFLYGISILLSDRFLLHTEISLCTYLIIIISIVNAFLPMDTFNESLFWVGEDESLTKTYQEAQGDFDVDYDRENPVYKREAIATWLADKNNQ